MNLRVYDPRMLLNQLQSAYKKKNEEYVGELVDELIRREDAQEKMPTLPEYAKKLVQEERQRRREEEKKLKAQ